MRHGFLGGVRRGAAVAVSIALIAQLITIVPAAVAAVAVAAPRELVEQRTAYSRVYDNGDGTFKFESYGEPIHYKDETTGRFEPIDSSLVRETTPSRAGWRNKANGFSVSLPEKLGSQWVSIESSAGAVACRPANPVILAEPTAAESATGSVDVVKHDTVSYADVFGPGVTLEYTSVADGLKETIVLDRYRNKNVFTFDLDTGGLEPRMTDDGGVGLYSAESTVPVFAIAPPYMEDSLVNDGDEPARSEDVSYLLVPNGSAWRLSVVADEEWLASDERVWPVRIDPTFYTLPFEATMDSYVTNAYRTTNYGSSTELKVGYYPAAGENYTYIMPDVALLMDLRQHASVQIIDANMNLYCAHRYDYGSGPVSYGPILTGWGETDVNWNNKPTCAYFGQGTATYHQRTRFDVESIVQTWMDTGYAAGVAFWAPVAGQVDYWTKFASKETWEYGTQPVFECAFTTRPKVTCSVATDTPSDGGPVATWTRDDYQYSIGDAPFTSQPQIRAEIEVRRDGSSTPLYQNTVEGTATSKELWAPTGGWTAGRYYVRLRVVTNVTGAITATSDWTAWQRFDVRSLTEGSDGAGIEGYRAADSAGGASVDLATGRLLLSRTDLAYAGLGGALGAGFVYDSARTTDAGAGRGWRVSMPTLGFDDQRAPNPGFEEGIGSGCPTGWWPAAGSIVYRGAVAHSGVSSAQLVHDQLTFGDSSISTHQSAGQGIVVVPGQRLDVSAWAATVGYSVGTGGGGAFAQIAYFDDLGALVGVASSPPLIEGNSTGWRRVALASVAPAGAARARLTFAITNSKGSVYFDDVYFGDGTMELTDGDGTARSFAQAGGGAYMRDPLAGTLALKRTNAVAGVRPTIVGTGGVTGASTDGSYAISTTSGYDYVINGTGTSLTFDLGEPKVLSEARLYLWDGSEALVRTHSYRLEYSLTGAAGSYLPLTGTISGARSWQTHYFAQPVKARYFRIAEASGTSGAFCLAELELPVTTLSESPVGFDALGRVTGIADTSGNIITYAYSTSGRLTSCSDAAGRRVELNWGTSALASLDFTGVGSESATPAPEETGIVSYSTVGDSLLVRRKAGDGSYVTFATYTYGADGRIASVTDADGVTAEVAYTSSGRVASITRSSESTPTVTSYDYSTPNQVTITTAGGGESVTRRVEFDPALGCQVTKVVADPAGANLATTYAYDAYGHVKSVTDPQGRVDTYTSDAHGNVTAATANSTGTEDVKLTTSATYTNDRVASTTDAKGNESFTRYDAKWRPISSTVAVTTATDGGSSSTEETYDEYGNVKYGELPGSSAANLLENGTFEEDPRTTGNGWTSYGNVYWSAAPSDQENLGYMLVTGGTGTPWLGSDHVAVTAGETYMASAWCRSGGRIVLSEYDAAGTFIRRIPLASVPVSVSAEAALCCISSTYVPPAGVAKISFELGLDGYASAAFDNARFEKANAAGPDNFIDNDSVERLAPNGIPESWAVSFGDDDVGDTIMAGNERVLRLYGGTGTTGTPWWESVPIPVTAGDSARFSVSVASDGLTQAAGGWAGVEVVFFPSYDCTWGTEISRVKLTGAKSITGSTSFTPYTAIIDVPMYAHWVKICPEIGLSQGSMYADHFTMEPVTARESYTYDATHTYLTETTTLTGAKVGAEADSRGRTTEVTHTDPGATGETVETARTYDAFDRMTGATTAPDSGLGITATFAYTAAGRLSSVTDPLSRTTTLAYDEGRIASVTTPSELTTAMSYDGLGRLASATAPYAEGEVARTAVEYAYDPVGRLAATTYRAEDGSVAATQTATYDSLSRPVGVTWSGPEAQGSLTYTYDALGRVTHVVESGPAGYGAIATTYDKASLPVNIDHNVLNLNTTTTNTFAKTGQWQTTRIAGGSVWSFTFGTDQTLRRVSSALSTRGLQYDSALELARVRLAAGSFTAEETLTYDGYGRVSGTVTDATASALDATESYGYDAAGRLVSWVHDGAATAYAYDAAGNLNVIDAPGTASDASFTSDADDRLTSATTGGETVTYASDVFGRRTSESGAAGDVTYAWNSLGQLVSVGSEDTTSTYLYGPTGMREQVRVETAQGATTTQSAWMGSRLASELDSDGTRYRYLYGPDGLPLELVVTTGTTSVSYAYQCDAAGSVVALTNASGAVVATYAYDPYGRVTAVGGSDLALAARNPLRYRGYYYDTETGNYYLPARYYDPEVARFLSADPASPSAGDPLSLNRYAYCLGDPINASDPSGAIADIWSEHPQGVTVGMKVKNSVAKAKRSGAKGWDVSHAKHSHRVVAQALMNPGSVRPSYTMTAQGWSKPEGYDSLQIEYLTAHGEYGFFDRPGKRSLEPSPKDPNDIAADAASSVCDITAAGIQTGAEATTGLTGTAALAASGPGVVIVAFAFLDAAAWTTAASIGSTLADYAFYDATLGDVILLGSAPLSLAYSVPGK